MILVWNLLNDHLFLMGRSLLHSLAPHAFVPNLVIALGARLRQDGFGFDHVDGFWVVASVSFALFLVLGNDSRQFLLGETFLVKFIQIMGSTKRCFWNQLELLLLLLLFFLGCHGCGIIIRIEE